MSIPTRARSNSANLLTHDTFPQTRAAQAGDRDAKGLSVVSAPERMRTTVIDRFGGPDVLRLTTTGVPDPGQREVLVRVSAAAVNAIDWKTRSGRGVPIQRFPAVLGWDVVGTVVAAGWDASQFKEGDPVFGMLRFPALAGAYAEYVAAPEDQLARKPDNVDHHQCAGAMVCLTAWESLFQHGALTSGQTVLVHGAAGGVGHVAVQLARWAGAEVIATASARSRDFLVDLGVSRVVDYRVQPVGRDVHDADVVVDTRGGEDFFQLVKTLRPGGIIITLLGQQVGQQEAANARDVRVGYTYVHPDGPTLARIAELMHAHKLRINIDGIFPLEDVASAHAAGDKGHVRGLLVLDISS
jgi:NADPH:quinone reductase-like Zn-dependent oxidoreductase